MLDAESAADLSLVQSGTALMVACSAHRAKLRVAIRNLERGQPLTNGETADLLEGTARLCTRLEGHTHLTMITRTRPGWFARVWAAMIGP
jgi:hypothetical protein